MINQAQRRLSRNERAVLAVAQLRARTDVADLAKAAGLPAYSVRYALNRLLQEGIVKPYPVVNFRALGFVCGGIFFTLCARRPTTADSVVGQLRRLPQATYISCFSTEPQYEVSFAVQSLGEAQRFADEVSRRLPLSDRTLCIRIDAALSGRKYLASRKAVGPPIRTTAPAQQVAIDQLDRTILSAMLAEPEASLTRIAQTIGVAPTTTRFRLRALEERGVIAGYRYHLQVERLRVLDYKLLIYVGAGGTPFRDRFESLADNHERVVHRHTCIGPWEYELDVEVENAKEVAAICQELRGQFPEEIVRIQTLPRFFSTALMEASLPFSTPTSVGAANAG